MGQRERHPDLPETRKLLTSFIEWIVKIANTGKDVMTPSGATGCLQPRRENRPSKKKPNCAAKLYFSVGETLYSYGERSNPARDKTSTEQATGGACLLLTAEIADETAADRRLTAWI
jgi:hypothetical protein